MSTPARDGVIPALDGLRGLAVLIVLLSHLANAGLPVLPGFSMSGIGKSGVYLFFVLSAFLLTRLLLDRPEQEWRRWRTWANYALRRVLRIWPLYLLVLIVSFAVSISGVAAWWPYPMTGDALLRHVLLQEGVSVLWSIPVEFHYYLWLPAVAAVLGAAQRFGGMPLVAIVAVGASIAASALWPAEAAAVNDVRLGPYLVLFIAGAWAAVVSSSWGLTGGPRPLVLGVFGATVLVLFVATIPAVAALSGFQSFIPDLNHRWFTFFAVVWSALVLAVTHGPMWLRRIFEVRLMRVMGALSFSVYLWHMPVLAAVVGPLKLTGAAALGVFLLSAGIVSWVSWRLVERPFQRVFIGR